ncbi:hypothetical protein SOCEGT47_018670 [Sorangium cellulosum]|uniref:PEGA domain-containing protein n=1 Tax=Sorangium cellulosum TaxID=56 RepID=A0A4P2PWZ6_SORCE|nr:hypothetical protein [Sorangium cellulosum]AUX21385.1 hypothetical protein SOCEGT47_018670 [Sorangium cellulosum]
MTLRRTRARARPLALLVVAAALLAAPAPAGAQSAADVAVAREMFIEGSELARQGRWEQARERYERSLELKRAPITLYSLGVAQQQTGQLVEALESFRAFLAEPSAPATKEYEPLARQAVQELERRVAEIELRMSPADVAGLTVKIDGVAVPAAALDRPRPVNPGHHEVTATAPGHREARRNLSTAPGSRTVVLLSLEREAAAPSSSRAAPSPASAAPPSSSTKPPRSSAAPPPSSAARGPRTSALGGPPGALGPAPEADGGHAVPIALLAGGLTTFTAGVVLGLFGVASASDAATRDGDEADAARAQALAGDIVAGAGLAVAGAGVLVLLLDDGPARAAAGARRAQPAPRAAVGPRGVTVRF